MSGTPARLSWHFGFSCSVALVVCTGDWAGLELLFAIDCEPADLEAVQPMETVIRKDMTARNNLMTHMMP